MRLPIEDFAAIEHIFGAYDLGTADALILETRNGKTHFAIERDGERSMMCSLEDWTPGEES